MNDSTRHDRMEELLAHSAWVRGVAQRLVRDPSAADDLVQETWLAALKNPPRRDGPVRGWLAGVVRNLARQRSRGEGRRARREQIVGARRAPLPSTDTLAQRMETQRDLAEAILQLGEPGRSTVILRYVDGLSSAEIARREDVPAGTVRARLKRAIDALRAALDERHGGDRRAWTALLLPFATGPDAPAPEGTGEPATLTHTAARMGLGAKILWSCGLLLVVVTALALLGDGDDAEDTETADVRAAPGADAPLGPSLETTGRARAADPRRRTNVETLDDVTAALRTLVGHSSWAVNATSARTKDREHEGLEHARLFVASLGETSATVVAAIYQFGEEAHAHALVAAERTKIAGQIDELRAAGFPASVITFTDGAGTDNALPGFHTSMDLGMGPHGSMQQASQTFSVGRFAVVLHIASAPRLNRQAQDEAIDFAAAVARNPVAARALPKPAPRDFDGMGRVLRLRIEGPDGEPVPSARGVVWKGNGASSRVTIHDGAGALALPNTGHVQVGVVGAKDAHGASLPLRPAGPIPVQGGDAELVVRLEPGLTIGGRVSTADGKPAEGIRVEARLDDGRGDGNVPPGPQAPNPLAAWLDVVPDPYTYARTSENGTFELRGLLDGPYRLRFLRGEAPALAAEPVVAAGTQDAKIELRPPSTFRITVYDPEGRAATNTNVNAHPASGRSVRTRTNEEGVATLIGLDPSATYTLSVGTPAGREDVRWFYRTDWRPADTTVRLESAWTLRGVVHDDRGQPLRAWVELRDGMGMQTDADGAFEFTGLDRHLVQIRARALGEDSGWPEENATYRSVEPTDERIVLTLTDALLTVRVTDDAGTPVPMAALRFSLLDDAGRVVRSWTDDVQAGLWRGKQPQQRFTLEVFRAASSNYRSLGLAPLRREGLDRTDDDITLRLAPGGQIVGRVTDAKGQPVARLELHAVPVARGDADPDESNRSRSHATTQTAADGTFTLKGLGAGRYTVKLELPETMTRPKPTEVVAGQKGIEIVLPTR